MNRKSECSDFKRQRGSIPHHSLLWQVNQSLLVRLHGGEEKHFLDVVLVSQEHGKSIDTHTPSSCWWETILESLDKVLVNALGFVITSILGSRLILEALKLYLRVV